MQNHRSPYSDLSDLELVTLAQQADNQAFSELIERHYGACFKLAKSILRDYEDARDEVQNACWKAFAHLEQFQLDAKFSTWLTRIVVNQCLMCLRRARRAKFVHLHHATADDSLGFELVAVTASPEVELGKAEVAAVIHKEIRQIPPLFRNVFLLRDVEHLPMQDVADLLGISVAAAKSRLLRARVELRNRLGRHQGRLGPATLIA
jgi:RNA polymerase sigma-70 factor (ECF subfamily)